MKLAGRFLRGESSAADVMPDPGKGTIGVSLPRPNALLLATGKALFTADIKHEGALELAVVRSPHTHALIKAIDTSAAERIPGVVAVLTAKDIKGTNRYRPDQPILCEHKVHVLGDAVAAVIAETQEQARRGAQEVKVEYEPLPEIHTTAEAVADGCIPDP